MHQKIVYPIRHTCGQPARHFPAEHFPIFQKAKSADPCVPIPFVRSKDSLSLHRPSFVVADGPATALEHHLRWPSHLLGISHPVYNRKHRLSNFKVLLLRSRLHNQVCKRSALTFRRQRAPCWVAPRARCSTFQGPLLGLQENDRRLAKWPHHSSES